MPLMKKNLGKLFLSLPLVQGAENQYRENISSGKAFTWENLNYHVPIPGGKRRLLHNVFGYVKPGSLTALMGASGAGDLISGELMIADADVCVPGKTTCLDVLAQRKNIGVISGDILVGEYHYGWVYNTGSDLLPSRRSPIGRRLRSRHCLWFDFLTCFTSFCR
jgi:hypothetical protein